MKKFIAFALALILILSLAACGGTAGPKPGGNENPSGSSRTDGPGAGQNGGNAPGGNASEGNVTGGNAPGKDYATCYSFYLELVTELGDTLNTIVTDHNARLEKENPAGYFSDPSYLMMFLYLPFVSIDMALTAAVTDDIDPYVFATAYRILGVEDAQLTVISSGNYKITYTMQDRDNEGKTKSVEQLLRYESESIRYEQRIDGELDEFYEFIALGNDRYALQGITDRAIVTYKDGQITEVLHSVNKYEMDYDTRMPKEGSVFYDPEADSAWGRKDLDENWVLALESSGGLERIYELKDGTLTISGQKSTYDWQTGVTTYEPMVPVVITVK